MMKYLQRFIEQNSTEQLLTALALAITVFIALYLLRALLTRKLAQWAKRSSTQWDDLLADVIGATQAASMEERRFTAS